MRDNQPLFKLYSWLRHAAPVLLILLAGMGVQTVRADVANAYPQARDLFPLADQFGDLEDAPRAAPVYKNGQIIGYVFLTADMVQIPAYSGRPINVLVGIDVTGRISGARIIHHEEPIMQAGISEEQVRKFVDQFRGKSTAGRITVGAQREGYETVDAVSGATITFMVLNATITRAVKMVALSRGINPADIQNRTLASPSPSATPAAKTDSGAPSAPRTHAAKKSLSGSLPTAPPAASRPARSAAPATSTPPPFTTTPDEDEEPMWLTVWRQRTFEITGLLVGLTILTLILLFQDYLARHPYLLLRVRMGFLFYTLFFVGWYAHGQLSIINVLTFAQAIMHQFSWDTFLIDPMLFLIWVYVAATLLLWGRGVYCGWLCPFGALQELTFKLARKLRLPFFEMPHVVHERLAALKLLILLGLFGISLQSMGQAIFYAEIEPFKTAISFRFQREWIYVAFALGLVALTAFNRKFYCKYLCPLGAALVIPGRFRSFDWLRRRKECGLQCQVCAVECEVQAVSPTGAINANECHYCLDCQVTFYNDHKCPPLAERRKKREGRKRAMDEFKSREGGIDASKIEAIPVRLKDDTQP
ncbi:MAG: 4Fe-4S binding protein [Hydrogenophilales bacterium]|nr:4Fe-4S binding protein [Hydrogenophilales bacterium]